MSERERDKERNKLQHTGVVGFSERCPRPWVPGEERQHCQSDWGSLQQDFARHKPQQDRGCPATPTPRRSLYNDGGGVAPLGYEPEGSAAVRGGGRRNDSCSPGGQGHSHGHGHTQSQPACIRWAIALPRLLEDPDGVVLFRRYLQQEGGPHADALDFWFACEGLRKHTQPDKIPQLVKVIYKRFFLKSVLSVSEESRREVARRVKDTHGLSGPYNHVFDGAQAEVERLINNTTYPNFLKSDMYLQYVQSVQQPGSSSELSSSGGGSGSSSSSSSISAREVALMQGQGSGLLPTLHEDTELVTHYMSHSVPHTHSSSTGSVNAGVHTPTVEPIRLTKDMLLVTQKRRLDVRPKPEAYAGMFASHGHTAYRLQGPYHAHANYSSYNPVSRQDSELQSLSSHSDVRTESDNMSLTDSSMDGMSVHRSSRKSARQVRLAKELAAVNREGREVHQTLIPRTQRVDTKQCQPMPPATFAAILIGRLEHLQRDQQQQDKLNSKLMESDGVSVDGGIHTHAHNSEGQTRTLADAIREKFHLDDDNDQDILDQHVSRVWSDLTPSLSPGRSHSPPRVSNVRPGGGRARRKDRDVFSTFSSDSGNVHDYLPDQGNMVKSKSMPEDAYMQERFVRQSASRRSSSKKTLTELTDSGVSVVSDTPPVSGVSGGGKESRVLTWLMESDRSVSRSGLATHSELSVGKHRGHRPNSATSPNATRHRKTFSQSRSSSLERGGGSVSGSQVSCGGGGGERRREPAQPFVADPCMPPMPPPHTPTQLEEARRRLMEDSTRPTRLRGSGKSYLPDSLSNQSTLRKSSSKTSGRSGTGDEFTTVVFSFCEEQFPYRTKIPGRQITLKQFKEYLPKKGNYRYFFKTECEELDNQVIQEEIISDSDLLPLWEGKVMAQVKPTD